MSGSTTLEIHSLPVLYPTPKGVAGTATTQDLRTSPGAAEAMPGVQTAAEINAATISTMALRRTRRFAGRFISVFPLLFPAPVLGVLEPTTPLAVSSARQFGWSAFNIASPREARRLPPDAVLSRREQSHRGNSAKKLSESYAILRQPSLPRQRARQADTGMTMSGTVAEEAVQILRVGFSVLGV